MNSVAYIEWLPLPRKMWRFVSLDAATLGVVLASADDTTTLSAKINKLGFLYSERDSLERGAPIWGKNVPLSKPRNIAADWFADAKRAPDGGLA